MSQEYCTKFSKKIAIVDDGLVGSLAALHLGKRRYEVHVYEYREDIRKAQLVAGRSINLALSARGRKALREVVLEDALLTHGIPMRGRMLHDIKGRTTIVPYDATTKQCIYSVERKQLNELLLSAAKNYPNNNLHFNHKLVSAKLKEGKLNFIKHKSNNACSIRHNYWMRWAFSTIRKFMLQQHRLNFSQTYVEHGYIELCIPPKNNEEYENSELIFFTLFIYCLQSLIITYIFGPALPNQDKTFTVTNFEKLETPTDILNFFGEYFADAISLIGKERLINDYLNIKPQCLVSVKCHPYHIDSKVLLMGDAAHAMVPFFGQGMNAGFEDCTFLARFSINAMTQCHNFYFD